MEGFERIQFDDKNDTCFSVLYCNFFFLIMYYLKKNSCAY